MFDLDTWREIIHTISKNMLRTFLTGMSVAWGIFMLMILLGVGNGLENGFTRGFAEDASNGIWIHAGETSIPHNGLQSGRDIQMTNRDHRALQSSLPEIEHISSEVYVGGWTGGMVRYGDKEAGYSLRGVHPEHKEIEFRNIISGRFINDADVKGLRKTAVIGQTSRDELFGANNPLGEYIYINDIPFVVTGVFEEDLGQNQRGRIYMPITTAQKVYGKGEDVNEILMTINAKTVEESKQVVEAIRNKMAFRHRFHPADMRALYIENNLENFQTFSDIFGGIDTFIWIVGLGTIIAGIVGIGNIMTVVIKERTKEIGIRKALGATPFSIVNQILRESILITGMFGAFGLSFGILLLEIIAGFITENNGMFYNPTIDFNIAVISTLLIVSAGTIAGLVPAVKAARITPINAMRAA